MDDFGYKKTKELEDETTEPEYNNLQANLKTKELVADLLKTVYAMDTLGLWTPNSLFGQVKFCRKCLMNYLVSNTKTMKGKESHSEDCCFFITWHYNSLSSIPKFTVFL